MNNPLNHTNIRLIYTKKKILLVFFSLVLVSISGLSSEAEAASASLYLSPSQGTFYVGSTFDISVLLNSEGNTINAVEADLKFPPELLQVVNPTTGKSFITIWADQPFYSNKEGIVSFRGGVFSPGINTSAGLVSTITFRAKASGTAKIYFSDYSQVFLADATGTNILKTSTGGEYLLTILPPEGPKIYSLSHPCLTCWSKNDNPSFFWEKEEGVIDFSYSLDQDPRGLPDNLAEGSANSANFNDIKDGIWYFHLKARKGEVWGGTSHYSVQLDKTAPDEFQINIEEANTLDERAFFANFSSQDFFPALITTKSV